MTRLALALPLALAFLFAAPAAATLSPEARAAAARAEARRATSRYSSGSTARADAPDLALRYRGLHPVRALALTPEAAPPAWALASYLLTDSGRPLRSPGLLHLELDRFPFPRRTIRDPMAVVEAYQELPDGRWSQMPATRRDPERARLHVHRAAWGTGRVALAYRLDQPAALLDLAEGADPAAPEFVYLHGVDGGLSDYSGPRDVLAFGACVASRVLFFQYPSGQPIARSARAFVDALARRRAAGELAPGRRRILFAYSLGGLVARHALERIGSPVEFTDVVLLAVPSRGAEWVDMAGALPFLSAFRTRVFRAWPGVRDALPRSAFLRALNARSDAPRLPRTLSLAGVVDGNGDLVVDADATRVPPHRRAAEYRELHLAGFLDLNRYAHSGVHQEFLVNGFGDEALRWLGLEGPCLGTEQARRWRRIRARLARLQ